MQKQKKMLKVEVKIDKPDEKHNLFFKFKIKTYF